MKVKFFTCKVIFALIFFSGSVFSQTAETLPTFVLEDILTFLRTSKNGLDTTNRIIIQRLKGRSVNLDLTAETEKILRETGANDGLIKEIKYAITRFNFDEEQKCDEKDFDCSLSFYNRPLAKLK